MAMRKVPTCDVLLSICAKRKLGIHRAISYAAERLR